MDSPPEWQPGPRLVTMPSVAGGGVLAWKGTDPFAFKGDRKSNAVSFVVHGIVIGLILWWGIASHHQFLQEPQVVVAPVDFKLTDPPPPMMQVAKVEGGGGGGGAHEIVPPTQAPLPKVPHIQTLPPQIARVENPKLAMEPSAQVNMPETMTMPKLGAPDSPQIALASQGSGSHAGFGIGMGGGLGSGHGTGAGAVS
jgi:hypothetical protein